MSAIILVLNCGSSSLKFAVINPAAGETLCSGLVERINAPETTLHFNQNGNKQSHAIPNADYESALHFVLQLLQEQRLDQQIKGIGHRVVHGGEHFIESTQINATVIQHIQQCIPLAPLHNPGNLQGIQAAYKTFPDLPQVAVFDTAFHQTLPRHAYLYALPQKYYKEFGVRRYGFHGISYRYVTAQALAKLHLPNHDNALLIAHLGNGCSACAVLNSKSIDTTMGMTPLEGLIMGSRTGDIDPGLPHYLAQQCGYSIAQITELFNKQSGLLGISGLSMDMRTLQQAAEQGQTEAKLAIDMFCYRLAKHLGALAMTLPRIDALIFTGGIGENAALIRAKTIQHLTLLGFKLDQQNNQNHGQANQGLITLPQSTRALVIPTNEELMIAQDTLECLQNCQF